MSSTGFRRSPFQIQVDSINKRSQDYEGDDIFSKCILMKAMKPSPNNAPMTGKKQHKAHKEIPAIPKSLKRRAPFLGLCIISCILLMNLTNYSGISIRYTL